MAKATKQLTDEQRISDGRVKYFAGTERVLAKKAAKVRNKRHADAGEKKEVFVGIHKPTKEKGKDEFFIFVGAAAPQGWDEKDMEWL